MCQQPYLEYYYHLYGQGIIDFKVEIDNGSGYQTLTTITGQQQNSSGAPWLRDSISLAAYADDTVRFRFSGDVNSFQGDLAMDQISVNGNVQPCSEPQLGNISNITTISADVSWVSASGNSELEGSA
ncbi:MAG: hypothetical protein U5L96_04845 [Owenweeksia sp.]|nr:hypothetical protein [Owenweeksia sp.]